MPANLTQLSALEYDNILYGHMTPAMAAAYLQEEKIPLRSFPEVLRGHTPSPWAKSCATGCRAATCR